MLHPNANALIIAADSWARVKALPARKRQVHHPEEAPSSDFILQSPQIRSKFCRGRACNQAWDPARAEHRCRTKALVRTLGPCKGKRSHARDPARRMPRKGATLAEAIQLAHARPSCTSLGRVSQDSSHHACQRASPTIFAVSCNGVLIIEFGSGIHKQRAPKSLATAPLKACFSTAKAMPPAT